MENTSERPTFESPLFEKPEGAGYLKVCPRTLDYLIAGGEIPVLKLGRRVLIRKTDLDQFIDARVKALPSRPSA